jgi:hypothetical protein
LDAHREAVRLLEPIDDQWGLALCKVLQARTLFDQAAREAAHVAQEGVENARRAGDRHVLGIALTQIAHMALIDGDHRAAITAASEALRLQEQIGYTEGMVSALHVLGQALRLAGDSDKAGELHRQALRLASRIGHAAAMCEAMEDLARAEAATRPTLARVLFRAARAEREAKDLPVRQPDAEELLELGAALASAANEPLADRPFASLVAELAG